MKQQTIVVDIDEVLSPLHDLVFAHHNEVYGTNFPLRDPTGSYFFDHYSGDSYEETIKKLKVFVDTEAFQNVQPLKGAVSTVNTLKKNFNLVIVTARQDFFTDFTQQWLKKHFPEVFSEVHFTEYVTGEGMRVPKLEFCKRLGANYLIDDNLETAIECSEAGIKVALFGEYPWNQTTVLPPGVNRCKDWPAVLEYFNERS